MSWITRSKQKPSKTLVVKTKQVQTVTRVQARSKTYSPSIQEAPQLKKFEIILSLDRIYQRRVRSAFDRLEMYSEMILSGSQGEYDCQLNLNPFLMKDFVERGRFQWALACLQGGIKKINYMSSFYAFKKIHWMMRKKQAAERIAVKIQLFQKKQQKKVCKQVIDILYGLMIHLRAQQQRQAQEQQQRRRKRQRFLEEQRRRQRELDVQTERKKRQSEMLIIEKFNIQKDLVYSRQQEQEHHYDNRQVRISQKNLKQSAIEKIKTSPRQQNQIQEITSILEAVENNKKTEHDIKNQTNTIVINRQDSSVKFIQKKETTDKKLTKNMNSASSPLKLQRTAKRNTSNLNGDKKMIIDESENLQGYENQTKKYETHKMNEFSSASYTKNVYQPPIQHIYIVKSVKDKRRQVKSKDRKPDDYIKIPITSPDVSIVEIITDSKRKKLHKSLSNEKSLNYLDSKNKDMTAKLRRHSRQQFEKNSGLLAHQGSSKRQKRREIISDEIVVDTSQLNIDTSHKYQKLKELQYKIRKKQKIILQKQIMAEQRLRQLARAQKRLKKMSYRQSHLQNHGVLGSRNYPTKSNIGIKHSGISESQADHFQQSSNNMYNKKTSRKDSKRKNVNYHKSCQGCKFCTLIQQMKNCTGSYVFGTELDRKQASVKQLSS